jgi:hypothetical protein
VCPFSRGACPGAAPDAGGGGVIVVGLKLIVARHCSWSHEERTRLLGAHLSRGDETHATEHLAPLARAATEGWKAKRGEVEERGMRFPVFPTANRIPYWQLGLRMDVPESGTPWLKLWACRGCFSAWPDLNSPLVFGQGGVMRKRSRSYSGVLHQPQASRTWRLNSETGST